MNALREGVSTGTILAVFSIVGLVLLGAGFALVLMTDPAQDKTIQASYKNLAKKRVTESPFPKELSAVFRRRKDRWFANGPVKNEDLELLSKKHTIDALEVNYSDLTYKGLKSLVRQPIYTIMLSGSRVTDEEMDVFSQIQTLRNLHIYDSTSPITDATVGHLTGPKQLRELTLRGTQITSLGVESLRKRFPEIINIDFMYSKTIDDQCAKSLSKFSKLYMVNVGFTGITAAGVVELSKLKQLQNLHAAGIGITGGAVKEIAKSKTIRQLNISDSQINNESLNELSKMPMLSSLQIGNCRLVTKDAIEAFKRKRPECKVQTFIRMEAKNDD